MSDTGPFTGPMVLWFVFLMRSELDRTHKEAKHTLGPGRNTHRFQLFLGYLQLKHFLMQYKNKRDQRTFMLKAGRLSKEQI